jgi:hypothetical protein
LHLIVAVQSVQEAAASLALQTAGASIDDVAAYLSRLGGIGAGLHDLLAAQQNVSGIFRESCTADTAHVNTMMMHGRLATATQLPVATAWQSVGSFRPHNCSPFVVLHM